MATSKENKAVVLTFSALRSDWYFANDIVPRHLVHALKGARVTFDGFPRQWLPLFALCGARWRNAVAPDRHIPLVSALDAQALETLIEDALSNGDLRTLVEAIACLDPILADALYIVDNKSPELSPSGEPLLLTSWASYGRPEVRAFERRALRAGGANKIAVALPCSRRRPYGTSATHKRIWARLKTAGVANASDPSIDHIVISSIGVAPRDVWDDPVVHAYDSGVPDIYRVLRLLRAYLKAHRYDHIIDCLSFEPYSDLLRIVHREGLINTLTTGPKARVRRFYVR